MNPESTTVHPDTTAAKPANPVQKFLKNRKAVAIVVAVVVIVIGLMLFSVWQQQHQLKQQPPITSQPWNTNPKFPPTQVMGTVGTSTIYGDDLNYKMYQAYPNSANMTATQAQALKTEIFNSVATDSAILLAAQAQNIKNVPTELINGQNKDELARALLVQQIRDQVKSESTSYVYSTISVWFYNMVKPSIPLTQAEQLASATINNLYLQLANNKIDMKQAGDQIKANKDLAKLDANYQGNAYSLVDNVPPGRGPSVFDELNQAALKLAPGQISPVVKITKVGKDATSLNKLSYLPDGTLDANEQFFAVMKLEKINQGKYPGLVQWIQQAQSMYPASIAK